MSQQPSQQLTAGPRSFWATVGGEIEENESLAIAALREIAGETGMLDVTLRPMILAGR